MRLAPSAPPSPSRSVSTSPFSTPCLHSLPASRVIILQGHHHHNSKTTDTTHTKKKKKERKLKASITDEHRSKNPWQNSWKQNPATFKGSYTMIKWVQFGWGCCLSVCVLDSSFSLTLGAAFPSVVLRFSSHLYSSPWHPQPCLQCPFIWWRFLNLYCSAKTFCWIN